MTGSYPKIEVLTGPERRRRWSVAEKLEIVAQTREAGVTVSLVARRCGVSPNQLFTWRRLAEQGALTATADRPHPSNALEIYGGTRDPDLAQLSGNAGRRQEVQVPANTPLECGAILGPSSSHRVTVVLSISRKRSNLLSASESCLPRRQARPRSRLGMFSRNGRNSTR